MKSASPLRAIALLVLLTSGSLLALVPPAQAQGAAFVCFDRDARNQGQCSAAAPPPNYLQGENVDIVVEGVGTSQPFIRVTCVTGCQEVAGKEYYARWSGETLRFPRDFSDPMEGRGSNANADRAPRYNGTWEATVLLGATPVTRPFNVWLFDLYTSPNMTLRPGENHYVRASGFDSNVLVDFRIERRLGAGGFEVLAAPNVRSDRNGLLTYEWQVPKDEATRIAECGGNKVGCYRFVVRGTGKADEIVPFSVGFADILPSPATSSFGPSGIIGEGTERTRNVTVGVDFYYPGGRFLYNQRGKLGPSDVPVQPLFNEHALRVSVEKTYVNETSRGYLLEEIPLRYVPEKFLWEATWTIPKDLPVEAGTFYRLRLPEARDNWGNRIAPQFLGNYTIRAANLRPELVESVAEVPRTEEARFAFAIRYHNGSLLTPEDNRTPLAGCFVVESQTTPTTCAAQPQVLGEFVDGLWVFKTRYARDYANLQAHRFILANGTQDKWGNAVWDARPDPFTVVAGSPRVEFTTVMRGRETQQLERGNYVSIQALVTYGDASPYNHTVQFGESHVLTGTLVRRGPTGAIQFEEPFNLTQTDPESGRWIGGIQLTHDDTATPLGTWTWRFDVRDNVTVPNANATVSTRGFDRVVVGAPILLRSTFQPQGVVETGTTQRFSYELFYDNGDGERRVPDSAVGNRVTARVHRYNPANLTAYGPPLSNVLQPLLRNGVWTLEYQVPSSFFTGTYVFVVSGADSFGNRLAQDAYSRAFTTAPKVVERGVLTQPAPEVRRGDSATVTFDAHEGDRGPSGEAVFIRVERFDPTLDDWVIETRDVRQTSGFTDHVGFFPVDISTPVGVYRFVLEGVDAGLNLLKAASSNFTVNATVVTRTIIHPPPDVAVKGDRIALTLEHQPGDRLTDSAILYNGRTTSLQPPILAYSPGRVNVTFAVPFEAPTGNYSVRVTGRDLNGNLVSLLSPQVSVQPANLTGRILGNPARVVERGEGAKLLFGITYPTGAFYLSSELPRVFVAGPGGSLASATVSREGLTFAATWTPPEEAPIGEYAFEVSGQGSGGNTFPPLRSTAFRVTPGAFARSPIADVGADVERMTSATFAVPFTADDRFVGFKLAYFGPTTGVAGAGLFENAEPITVSALAHTLDASNGRYTTRFVTDHATQTGAYRIVMEGEDAYGNEITSRSRVFIVRATSATVTWDGFPPIDAFGEGKTITVSFTARYRAGPLLDESYGRPSAVMLYNGRPTAQRPEIEFREGHWYLTWVAPATLPDGEYLFSVGGADLSGNVISTSSTIPYPVRTTATDSFAKVIVPGPSPVLLALLACAAALALSSRMRRREP